MIARVFPTRTSMTPADEHAYTGPPGLFVPKYQSIHISVTFTWDLDRAKWLARQWERVAPVKLGGVAIDGEGEEFTPGMYVRPGVTVTSRGCPNRCPWCFIRKPLRELPIQEGNNIIDNNVLACSERHLDLVFAMLQSQHAIKFSGGLEAGRITDKVVDRLRGIRLKRLFTAYDDESRLPQVKIALEKLRKHFSRDKISCFVLMGFNNDTPDKALGRLQEVFNMGANPFAMLYRDRDGSTPEPRREWKKLQRTWARPALAKRYMKKTLDNEYNAEL